MQTDMFDQPYKVLPPVMNTDHKPAEVDQRFRRVLPTSLSPSTSMLQPTRRSAFWCIAIIRNQMQINGGRNDHFAAISDAGGLVMGYYDGHTLPLWQYASHYTLA